MVRWDSSQCALIGSEGGEEGVRQRGRRDQTSLPCLRDADGNNNNNKIVVSDAMTLLSLPFGANEKKKVIVRFGSFPQY